MKMEAVQGRLFQQGDNMCKNVVISQMINREGLPRLLYIGGQGL